LSSKEREKEREREAPPFGTGSSVGEEKEREEKLLEHHFPITHQAHLSLSPFARVCVWEREKERQRGRGRGKKRVFVTYGGRWKWIYFDGKDLSKRWTTKKYIWQQQKSLLSFPSPEKPGRNFCESFFFNGRFLVNIF